MPWSNVKARIMQRAADRYHDEHGTMPTGRDGESYMDRGPNRMGETRPDHLAGTVTRSDYHPEMLEHYKHVPRERTGHQHLSFKERVAQGDLRPSYRGFYKQTNPLSIRDRQGIFRYPAK